MKKLFRKMKYESGNAPLAMNAATKNYWFLCNDTTTQEELSRTFNNQNLR